MARRQIRILPILGRNDRDIADCTNEPDSNVLLPTTQVVNLTTDYPPPYTLDF